MMARVVKGYLHHFHDSSCATLSKVRMRFCSPQGSVFECIKCAGLKVKGESRETIGIWLYIIFEIDSVHHSYTSVPTLLRV